MRIFSIINNPKTMGQLRHLINTVGAALAMYGVVQETNWQIYSGLVLAILAFIGSIKAKEKQ